MKKNVKIQDTKIRNKEKIDDIYLEIEIENKREGEDG